MDTLESPPVWKAGFRVLLLPRPARATPASQQGSCRIVLTGGRAGGGDERSTSWADSVPTSHFPLRCCGGPRVISGDVKSGGSVPPWKAMLEDADRSELVDGQGVVCLKSAPGALAGRRRNLPGPVRCIVPGGTVKGLASGSAILPARRSARSCRPLAARRETHGGRGEPGVRTRSDLHRVAHCRVGDIRDALFS